MTRESRLLLTVAVMAGLGVAGLMVVANQYRKALTTTARRPSGGDDATVRAVRLVDGYLAARVAVKDVEATEAYRLARWNAFNAGRRARHRRDEPPAR